MDANWTHLGRTGRVRPDVDAFGRTRRRKNLGSDRIRSKEVISRQGQTQMTLGRDNRSSGVFLSASETLETQLQEEKEETQCINAFWTVLALNSRWAAVEGYGSSFPYWKPAMRIDTPWPWVSYLESRKYSDYQSDMSAR